MRHTTRAILFLPIGLIGIGLFAATLASLPRGAYGGVIWSAPPIAWLFVAALLAAIGAGFGLTAFSRSFAERRLDDPANVVADWHVARDEWDRFRALDAARGAQFPTFGNRLGSNWTAPSSGVRVVVGQRDLRLGNAYCTIRSTIAGHCMADVLWLEAEPAALEFTFMERSGRNSFLRVARLPVAAAAEAEARAALAFHQAAIVPDERARIMKAYEDHFLARDVSPARGHIARRRSHAWGVVTLGAVAAGTGLFMMLDGEVPLWIARWIALGGGALTLAGLAFVLLYRRR